MASEDLNRSVLNCRSSWVSNLPRLWVLEVLACSKETDLSLLLDLVKKTPEIFEDIGKNVRELVSLRILESFYDQGVRVDSVSKKIGFDPSEQCEDVLRRILPENCRQASVSDMKKTGLEMLKWDFQPFIVHKRSKLAQCSLQKLKDAILIGSHPLPSSLKEQSGLVGGNQPEDEVPVEENNDNDMTTKPEESNTNDQLITNDQIGAANDQLIYPTLANCSNRFYKNKPGQNLLLSKRKRSSAGESDRHLQLTDTSLVIVQHSEGEQCTSGKKSHVVGPGKSCSIRDDDNEHTQLKRHAGPNEVFPSEEQVHNFVPYGKSKKDNRGLHLLANAITIILQNSEGDISNSGEKTNVGGMGNYSPSGVCNNNQTSRKSGINLDEILSCEKQFHHCDTDMPNEAFDEEQKRDHDVKDAEGGEECVSELKISKKGTEPQQNLRRNVCETEDDYIFCGNDVLNDDMTDIARRKNAFLDSQVTNFQESLEKVDWSELNRCIKCNKSGKLLICHSSSCFSAIHKSCLGSDAIFEKMEEFYCPFCAYSLALSKYLEVKAKVSLARKDLATFLSWGSRSHGVAQNHLELDDDSHKITDFGEKVNRLDSRKKIECEDVSPSTSSSSGNPPRKSVASADVLTKDLNRSKQEGEGMGQESQSPRVHGQSQMAAIANHISQDKNTVFRSKKEVMCPPRSDFLSKSTSLPVNESTDEDEITGEGSEDSGFSKYFISIRNHKGRSSNPGTPQLRRKGVPWTVEEEQTLKNGMQRLCRDHNKSIPWKKILDYGENVFHESRTAVDLKDKWRNLKKLQKKFDPSDEDAQMT